MVYRVDAGKSFLQTNYFITNLNFTKMLNKILKITAAAAFMVALAVNIDMMINDPFVGMSTEAIATDTGDTGGTSGWARGILQEDGLCYCCEGSMEVLCDCRRTTVTCVLGGPLPDCTESIIYDYYNCELTGNLCSIPVDPKDACPSGVVL